MSSQTKFIWIHFQLLERERRNITNHYINLFEQSTCIILTLVKIIWVSVCQVKSLRNKSNVSFIYLSFFLFAVLIETGYHSNNPYHNALHAADVTQAMHCYLQEKQVSLKSSQNAMQHVTTPYRIKCDVIKQNKELQLANIDLEMCLIHSNSRPCPYKCPPIIFWSYKPYNNQPSTQIYS